MSGFRNTSPLLINESPLQVLPSLAVLLGLNEAMILQQIHFWLCNKDKRCKPYINEGEAWVYNTYEEWHEQFPFWSVPTIKRAVLNLEEQGVLVTRQFDKQRGDAKKYYRIDHEKLTSLLDTPSDQIDPTPEINLISPSDQIDLTVGSKRSDLIRTETTTENTTERERARALSLAVTPFTSETEPTTEAELKAEKLFPVIHGGCTLPPKLDRKIERRIYNCIDNLVLGNFTVEEVQAFIADWRLNKSIALTPERVASDIGEWRRLRTPAPVLNLPPKPDTKGMSVGEERKALSAWFQACQQLKQQTGVAA